MGIRFFFMILNSYSRLEVGYESVDIDQQSTYANHNDEGYFTSPYPPPTLPTGNWPRAQGNIPIYLRPTPLRPASDAVVDNFLSSIELPVTAPAPATEAVSSGSQPSPEDFSSDQGTAVSTY